MLDRQPTVAEVANPVGVRKDRLIGEPKRSKSKDSIVE